MHSDPSPTAPPLTKTSRLSLSGIETATAGEMDVTCTVVQNLPAQFNAVRQRSIATVAVVESHVTGTFMIHVCGFVYIRAPIIRTPLERHFHMKPLECFGVLHKGGFEIRAPCFARCL